MTRYDITLYSAACKKRAVKYIEAAPYGTRLTLKAVKRTLPQNAKLWAMLTDLSEQVPWHGMRLRPEDWKILLLDALKRELRMVPNMDGDGFVNLGRSSSDLSKGEMADLIELMYSFGAKKVVVWSDPNERAGHENVGTDATAP